MNRLKTILRSPVALGGLIAAGIVFAVAGAAILTGGFTQAQETPGATAEPTATDATPQASTDKLQLRDEFLDKLATELNISRDQLDQALKNVSNDMVDEALADGRITEDEAARIRDAIANGKVPFFGMRGFHRGFGVPLLHFGDLADFLGVQPADIVSGLKDGQSLTQIAEAHGKSRDELKTFLTDKVNAAVDQAVQNGRITEDRAAEIRDNASTRIDQLIDHEGLPLRQFGPGRFGKDGSGDVLPEGLLDEALSGPLL